MGDAKMLMDALSGGGLATFVMVLAGVLCLIKLLDAGIEIAKKWRKSGSVEDQRKSCEQKFATDKRRLDALEAGQDALVYGVAELLGHALHNGNSDEMEKAEKKLKTWLYER